jgi:hypothetical protein
MTEPAPSTTLTRKRLYNLVWSRPLNAVAREVGISEAQVHN